MSTTQEAAWKRIPKNPLALVRYLTLQQWRLIDEAYKEKDRPTDLVAVGVFLLAALVMTLQRYIGTRRFYQEELGSLSAGWPYQNLWGHVYWSAFCIFTYAVLPSLYVRWFYRESLSDYGLKLKGAWANLPIYLAMFLVVFPFVVIASASPAFLQRYPFYAGTGHSWSELVLWEGAYGLQFLALEYFFRGFMLFSLARVMGSYAVFVMVIPYTMIHYSKPMAETFGAIIAGTALGTLALRTRSILGGVLIHVAVAWSMDLLALWRKGELLRLLAGGH